jgi:hypothetical protein
MEEKEMERSHRMFLQVSAIALITRVGLWSLPGLAQESGASGQAAPSVSGTGHAGDIPIWKNNTTLGNSVLSQSGGNMGIGTTAPVAKLEINGDAQVDGNFSLSGSILLTGVGPLIQAPNNGLFNFSAGLGALGL